MPYPSRIIKRIRLIFTSTLILWALTVCGDTPSDSVHYDVLPGEPATLTFWNRPIVTLNAQIGNATPHDRVRRGTKNIAEILTTTRGTTARVVPASLANLTGYWLEIDGQEVIGLIPEDVESASGESLEMTAKEAAAALQEALNARQEQLQLPTLLMDLGLTLGASVVLGLILWGVFWVHRRTLASERLLPSVEVKIGGIDLHPFLRAMERGAVKVTSFGVTAIAVYIWLTYVLGLYPLTRPLGDGLAGYLVGILVKLASGALGAIPGLFTVLVIFVVTRMVVRTIDSFFGAVEHGMLSVSWLAPDTAKASRRLTNVLIWIFALTVAYPYIPGSDSDAFKGISVFVGLMVSLGSAGLINQVMSGLVVAYSRALKAGEYVKIGESEGTVSEVGMLSTKVITPKREAITVPNAVLVSSSITNYSRLAGTQGTAVGTTVTIGYDTPWRQVHAMLALAAERTPGVRKDPKPFVLQRGLSDYYAEYQLVVSMVRPETRIRMLSDLHANIQDVFNEFGVQIMSPHFKDQPADKVWVPKEQWFPPPCEQPVSQSERPSDSASI